MLRLIEEIIDFSSPNWDVDGVHLWQLYRVAVAKILFDSTEDSKSSNQFVNNAQAIFKMC
jgi:hypothetical protein